MMTPFVTLLPESRELSSLEEYLLLLNSPFESSPDGEPWFRVYFTCAEERERFLIGTLAQFPALRFESGELREEEWNGTWVENQQPIQVGDLHILPPSMDPQPGAIVLDPGRSFGWGAHPTSRLLLEVLCRESLIGKSVLDVGCASGVLSLAAAWRGARQVTGIDVDQDAILKASDNARRNNLQQCSFSTAELSSLSDTFDLVLANLIAPTLIELRPHLARVSRRALLSGILAEDESTLSRLGFEVEETHQSEGWIAVIGRFA